MHYNKDLQWLNITIDKYDLDLIKENANSLYMARGDLSTTMALVEATLNHMFKAGLLDPNKVVFGAKERIDGQ